MVPELPGGSQDRLRRSAAGLIPADTAGLLLHVAKQRFGAAQVIVDALAADPQLLADLTQGQVLVVAQLEAFPLTLGQQIAVVIIQQNQFLTIHSKPPSSITP